MSNIRYIWNVLLVAAYGCSSNYQNASSHEPDDGGVSEAGVEAASGDASNGEPDAGDEPDVGSSCSGPCVAPAPSGWNGPVEMATGPVAPPCVGDWLGTRENAGLNASPAICTCSCGAPTGFSCSVQATCGTNACASCGPPQTIQSNQCVMPATYSVILSSPTASGGTCTPSVATLLPSITWSDQIQSCSPSVAPTSCGSGGDKCLPATTGPNFNVCISQSGDVACPAGPYGVRTLGYAGAPTDTRGCGSCSCGAPSGISCGGSWVNYGVNTCSGGGTPNGLNDCVATNGVSSEYIPNPSGGWCTPSNGDPTGSVTPTGPVTFCCLP